VKKPSVGQKLANAAARLRRPKISSGGSKPALMSPVERRKLVEAPFPMIRVLPCSYPWSGVMVDRDPFKLRPDKQLVTGDITKFSVSDYWEEFMD
jgi:hypothetical protein